MTAKVIYYEANISTEQDKASERPRFFVKDVDEARKKDLESTSSKGKKEVGRIRGRNLKPFSFRKSERLLRRADFQGLWKRGYRFDSDYFLVLYSPNGLRRSRLGVTVSRKVGGAVIRNRIKRLVREHFRGHKAFLSDCYDVNVIAKRDSSELSSRQLRDALQSIVGRIIRDCKDETVSVGTH